MADNKHAQHDDKAHFSTAPPWNPQIKLVMTVGFGILLILLAVIFWSIIPFALTTAVVAYLLNPLTRFNTKYLAGGKRGWGVMWTFVTIILFVLFVVFALAPPLVEQTISGVTSVVNTFERLINEPIIINEDLSMLTDPDPESDEPISIAEFVTFQLDQQGFDTFNSWLTNTAQNLEIDRETLTQVFNIGGDVTTSVLGSIFSIAGTAIGFVFNSLFFVTILAMFLAGGENMVQTILNTAPDGYRDDVKRLLCELGEVWDAYVRGNLILGLIMSVIMWIFATIMGLPNPLFLAFVAFAMEFIPNIGATITMAVAALLALASGSTTFEALNGITVALIVIGVWIVMQNLQAIILVPRITGEALKLHPAVVILAVIWGGTFGGIVGIIIAPPLVSSFRVILQYIYGRLTGREAFSSVEEDDNDDPYLLPNKAYHPREGVV
ncbi:MAG: AI-2E family transporter, partial [Chloroflexota bacterium]